MSSKLYQNKNTKSTKNFTSQKKKSIEVPKPKPNKKSEKIASSFRKKMSDKLNIEKVDVVNWLHNSHANHENWIKSEKDKIMQHSVKECTFKPSINKTSKNKFKSKFTVKGHDTFEELYLKAKSKNKTKNIKKTKVFKPQYEQQNLANSDFLLIKNDSDKENQSKYETNELINYTNNRSPEQPSEMSNHRDSNQGSIPDAASGFKPLDTYEIDYVNRKIEELKGTELDYLHYESLNHEISPSKLSPISPLHQGE